MTSDNYKESYGYKLAERRNEAKLTQQELADKLNDTLGEPTKRARAAAETFIRMWEANRRAPENDQFDALNDILVDALKLKGEEKNQFLREMRLALNRSRIELAAHLKIEGGRAWYGDKLIEAMNKAGINENALIDELVKRAGVSSTQFNFEYVWKVEAGKQEPSEEFKRGVDVVFNESRKKKLRNIVSYIVTEFGDDIYKYQGIGGRVAENIQHGRFGDTKREYNLLTQRSFVNELYSRGIIDDKYKILLDGPYKGEHYINLLNQEYERQQEERLRSYKKGGNILRI